MPRLIIALVLLPLFVPGISMGLATGLFFQILGFKPSLLTITAVQVLWALPFAFLIILTVMASFDQVYLEAAYMSGAGRVRAFLEVELPQIHQGILGAAVFSLIISFNETIRTSVVQGAQHGADLPLVPVPAGRPEPAPVRAHDADHRRHPRPRRAHRLAPGTAIRRAGKDQADAVNRQR